MWKRNAPDQLSTSNKKMVCQYSVVYQVWYYYWYQRRNVTTLSTMLQIFLQRLNETNKAPRTTQQDASRTPREALGTLQTFKGQDVQNSRKVRPWIPCSKLTPSCRSEAFRLAMNWASSLPRTPDPTPTERMCWSPPWRSTSERCRTNQPRRNCLLCHSAMTLFAGASMTSRTIWRSSWSPSAGQQSSPWPLTNRPSATIKRFYSPTPDFSTTMNFVEEMLFCKSLKTTTTVLDIYTVVKD